MTERTCKLSRRTAGETYCGFAFIGVVTILHLSIIQPILNIPSLPT